VLATNDRCNGSVATPLACAKRAADLVGSLLEPEDLPLPRVNPQCVRDRSFSSPALLDLPYSNSRVPIALCTPSGCPSSCCYRYAEDVEEVGHATSTLRMEVADLPSQSRVLMLPVPRGPFVGIDSRCRLYEGGSWGKFGLFEGTHATHSKRQARCRVLQEPGSGSVGTPEANPLVRFLRTYWYAFCVP
jgi:hypothetical protein